jgi:hypothetical protein
MQMLFSAMYGAGTSNEPISGGGASQGSPPGMQNFRTYMYINVLAHPMTNTTGSFGNAVGADYPSQSIVQVSFKLYSAWIGSLAYSDIDAGGNAVSVEHDPEL